MTASDPTFAEMLGRGEVSQDDIDRFVQTWHHGRPTGLELHEYLGLSREHYAAWVLDPGTDLAALTAEWRDVRGYEGLYEVSDRGGVRRAGSLAPMAQRLGRRSERLYVRLSRTGFTATVRVDEVVARAFLSNTLRGADIGHANGDAADSRVENLTYPGRPA